VVAARPAVDARGALRRMLTFGVALLALLGFARSGQAAVTVWVVFAIFVAVSAVWVRGQYADSLDGRQWVIPYRVGAVLVAVAIALIVLSFTWDTERVDRGLPRIGGVVLIYLVAGSAVTQVRQTCSIGILGRKISIRHWGIWLTLAGLVVAAVGATLLVGMHSIVGAVLLAAGAAGLIPLGMGIGSEPVIRWLCGKEKAAPWLWGLGAGGAVLYAATAWIAVVVSRSSWLIPVLIVLALFMIAMVSTTHADIVAVTAGVALMGVMPAELPAKDLPSPGANASNVLVAIGDSYMSGEGASVFYEEPAEERRRCNRAPSAWAVLIAKNEPTFDGLKFLACAGAKQADVVEEQLDKEYAEDPEYGHYRPGMVVLSLGGNDVGFSTIAQTCLAPRDCTAIEKLWHGMIQRLPEELREAYRAVDERFPGVPVVVVPYPQPITAHGPCDQVAFSETEREFIRRFTSELNQKISDTAAEFGFHYLREMEDALVKDHLQLCDPGNGGRPGINFIGLRSVHGLAEERFNPTNWTHTSLHPNERGHLAMRRVFRDWLAAHPKTPSRRALEQPTVTTEQAPCDLEACKRQARRWAVEQVGHRFVDGGLLLWLAAAAGGAWLVAVAFFAYRRRVYAACG
jgi:GDSL-like Lipase/Acylhydrolase family